MRILLIVLFIAVAAGLSACSKIQTGYLSAKAMAAVNGGNFTKAEELYLKIIEIEPNVPDHHWQLAGVYISSRRNAKARQEIETLRRMGRDDLADQLFIILHKPDE